MSCRLNLGWRLPSFRKLFLTRFEGSLPHTILIHTRIAIDSCKLIFYQKAHKRPFPPTAISGLYVLSEVLPLELLTRFGPKVISEPHYGSGDFPQNPCFSGYDPNPLELFRKLFGAVRAIFWLCGSFLAPDLG